MAPSLPSSPEGIIIHRHWRIGKKIGDGACGSVHELVNEKDKNEANKGKGKTGGGPLIIHAIKLAPLPDPNAKAKSKESVLRKTHADILHYEALVYQNHLVDLRGTLIPELPLRPVTGDVEGKFVASTRMELGTALCSSFEYVKSYKCLTDLNTRLPFPYHGENGSTI
jgi:hypothetical protein